MLNLTNIQKRFILFLGLCIPIRILLTYIVKTYTNNRIKLLNNIKLIKLIGYLSLFPIIGWLYIIFISPRNTGPETFGDKIWWNSLRPFHLLLYITFAYLALSNNKEYEQNSWIPLALDVCFGLISFLIYHKSQGNI